MEKIDNGISKIKVAGAREHNLKNITVEIPKNKLVVFTGLSGSGKSSLAFDTIYAEGQRRYVESLSSYARQFLGIMDKPDVDYVEGLSPAIAIDQKSVSHNPRSTVGTITEIYDYLRLLFARIGHPHCPKCGREISNLTLQQIVDQVQRMAKEQKTKSGFRIFILAPVVKDRKGEFSQLFEDLGKKGFRRIRIDGTFRDLSSDFVLIKTNRHTIDAIVDRLVIPSKEDPEIRRRLSQSIETALKLSGGDVIISEIKDKSFGLVENPKEFSDHLFSERFACPNCNISISEIEPRTFSFNSPHGACPSCSGLGSILSVDPTLVLAPDLTIAEGSILPFSRMTTTDSWFSRLLETVSESFGFSLNTPISDLSQEALNIILYGASDDKVFTVKGTNRFGRMTSYNTTFEGVIPNLERRYKETESDFMRKEIERFMRSEICPSCKGTRLKPEALSITIDNLSIIDVTRMSITESFGWISNIKLSVRENAISTQILKELVLRLGFLKSVGLEYLTLDRSSGTLSGGEAQRIRLASQVGSGLSGVLYVLDEPSIGLHQRDNKRLIDTLKRLRDLGNSVIVVEHDREMMEESDYIFDFGPGAGEHGGNIIAEGTREDIIKNPKSLTGDYLSNRKIIDIVEYGKGKPNGRILKVAGATEHNLKEIDVDFPLGLLIGITGVSGSGKSTLINDVLYRALAERFWGSRERAGKHKGITGAENLDKVVLIDQSPIGRTPRSNPATYTGAFTPIRELFAMTPDARARGYKAGRFSFNVKGGRCENCEGEGQIKIEMQFLPDVYIDCEVCGGKRYNREALEILYKGKNIAEVLDMTVEEALEVFINVPTLASKLFVLNAVGLGYIKLGQPAPTLSGGEAQRVKLSSELSRRSTGRTLYILDEPTTGLHFADIEKLLRILRQLVSLGNTVIIIEHNLDVIKNCDYLIDLGPEGGDNGGEVIGFGTPYEVSKNKKSFTGQFLKTHFNS